MAWIGASIIGGGLGFLGGLLDDSGTDVANVQGQYSLQAAQAAARKSYPGQKDIAKALAPYLWENYDVGLTDEEKTLYRSEGKTNILQASKANVNNIKNNFASQGLKGGAVATNIKDALNATLPQFANLETGIMKADIAKKQQSLGDIFTYLSLAAGEGEDVGSTNIYDTTPYDYSKSGGGSVDVSQAFNAAIKNNPGGGSNPYEYGSEDYKEWQRKWIELLESGYNPVSGSGDGGGAMVSGTHGGGGILV